MTTQQQLNSYQDYQTYLINEMLPKVPLKNGKKLQENDLQRWNKSMYNQINKLEREIRRLQAIFTQEQIDSAKEYYLSSMSHTERNVENIVTDEMDYESIKAPEGFKSDKKKYLADYYKEVRKPKLIKSVKKNAKKN